MKKTNATCPLTSFRRSDQLLSVASVCVDDDSLGDLRHDDVSPDSHHGLVSTDLFPSCDSYPPLYTNVFGEIESTRGDLSSSGEVVTPQYHSDPSVYDWNFRLREVADAVAGIPRDPSQQSSSSLNSGSVNSSFLQSQQERVESSPQQVEDVEDDELLDWSPIEDLMQRIESKIKFLKKSEHIPESDVKLLFAAKGILFQLFLFDFQLQICV